VRNQGRSLCESIFDHLNKELGHKPIPNSKGAVAFDILPISFAGAMWGKMASCGGLATRLPKASEGRLPIGRKMPSCPTKGPLALRTLTLRYQPFCRRIALAPTFMSRTRLRKLHRTKRRKYD
jgi:hypothetical protein